MTNAELIALLQTLPPELPVVFHGYRDEMYVVGTAQQIAASRIHTRPGESFLDFGNATDGYEKVPVIELGSAE